MKFPAFISEDPERALQDIILVLNPGPCEGFSADAHANLVRLIRDWQDSGPNLLQMKFPPGCPNLFEMQKSLRALISPTGGSRAYYTIAYVPTPKRPWTAWDFACQQFIRLITNPECERFGGPCPRCNKYFIRAGAKQKLYCSRECGSAAAALESTRQTRDREHADKLARAAQSVLEWKRDWKKGRTKKGWKEYVCMQYPNITPKFLTRAVNNDELSEPAKERN
jgi:hypothetical protein